jgi:dihydroorotase/N-acyl-D-amino-acid deacylase
MRKCGAVLPGVLATLAWTCAAPAGDQPARGDAYDVVIANGRIVDGTGNAWYPGDIGLRGDRIARIGPPGSLSSDSAATRVDATGLVVAPGFIDIQSHSRDAFLIGDGRVVSKISQGITTEIMGEGWTNAPANDNTLRSLISIDPGAAADSIARRFVGPRGFNAWLEAMQARGVSPNIGSFAGATTIRIYAKGGAEGPASPAELDTMRAVTRQVMEDGAFGVASALIYPPGNFASTEELIEIARAMAPYGGMYISHMRSEADHFLEAIRELLRIGREGGVPAEIYHLKAAGVRNWPKAAQAVALIDSARTAGQDVQANMYPYVAGGTGLAACTPPWASANDQLIDNLKDATTRARVITEMRRQDTPWENLCLLSTAAGVMTVGYEVDSLKRFEGKRLAEIAADWRKDWANTVVDLLLATEGQIGMLVFMMSEPNVEMQLQQPWIKIGTDAGGFDPDSATGLTHPRAYGTYPRILGHYVRDRKVLSIEEAVRKMSSAVAVRLGIRDRGQLAEGFMADVVVFDAATIADRATFTEPHQLSTGVQHVFVNGTHVWHEGRHTGATPGRIVRGPGWSGGRTP